ncbi:hypothetical protein BS78_10G247000 [Paspalum vaginatum]|nr:hypothetical protein BS78_10G247000 [Paspalum vaginatum]
MLRFNSNCFCGLVPTTLRLLAKLDIGNNCFVGVGAFPAIIPELLVLKFLDLRFNDFEDEGAIPRELFDRSLYTIFLSHNCLRSPLSDKRHLGNSPASVIVEKIQDDAEEWRWPVVQACAAREGARCA